MDSTKKAVLVDIEGNVIFEIGCFKKGTPYSEVCLLNLEKDYFTGDVFVNNINYQQAATSIYDNLMYERGIMLQRSNDYCFLYAFLEFAKTLGEYLEQETEINGRAIFLSAYHDPSLIYDFNLVRNTNDTFTITITMARRNTFSERLHELLLEKFPHLALDASYEFEAIVEKNALENFLDAVYRLIGKATIQSYL
ncbi:MAG: hypothetical protein Q8O20_10875 [Sulfuricurvum sp.]|uniref:hypothetical protein n=1 Tax=Sulfuricurvum sp. TaxID=2025608 RepID=UPI002733C2BA|nr:hypothetical protein [Sulfuricurvum sp.]MDP2851563.1 hypothetical protein [Sulfuricurvum sp.]